MRRRALAALVVAAALTGPATAQAQTPVGPPDGSRIAMARMYQDEQYTAKNTSPAAIGAGLAAMRPTYVSALLRYSNGEKVRPRQVRAWDTVESAVRAVSPAADFSVELNALEYKNAADVRRMMQRVRSKLDNDGWLFDFYTPAAKHKPKVVRAAVASAHANGEFLGGNAFGIAQKPPIPAGTDYIAVQDFDFNINLTAVRALAQRTTVFFHLGNSPNLANSDGCQFIENYTTTKRIDYVRMRASQQEANHFRFAYPVLFPECERNRNQRNATIFTYNAFRDDPMATEIEALMTQYPPSVEPPPAP